MVHVDRWGSELSKHWRTLWEGQWHYGLGQESGVDPE
jgi:hypothetical protein